MQGVGNGRQGRNKFLNKMWQTAVLEPARRGRKEKGVDETLFWLQRGHIRTSQGSFFIEPVEEDREDLGHSPLHVIYRIPRPTAAGAEDNLAEEPTHHCGMVDGECAGAAPPPFPPLLAAPGAARGYCRGGRRTAARFLPDMVPQTKYGMPGRGGGKLEEKRRKVGAHFDKLWSGVEYESLLSASQEEQWNPN